MDTLAVPAPTMDADPFGPEELQRASVRMQQYARWASPPNLLFAALLVVMYPYTESVLTLILAVLLLGNAACALVAHRLAARRRPAAAVLWQVSSLWLIALLLGLSFGISAFAPAAMCAILPIAAAVPYVSQRTLLRMAVISVAVVGACAVCVVVPPPLSGAAPEWAVRQLERTPNVVGVTILTAVCGLSLWHTRFTLGEALTRVQLANRALEDSERSLEDEVRQRTAELERSQREVALARDEALAANQRKSTFLANMSHELRTPLNAIIGFSEVMEARLFGELNEKQHEYVRDILQSGQHLLSLINDILDLSKVETGRVELATSRFDLAAAVGNAMTLMRERATRSGIRLVQKLDPSIRSITADERRLKQVLINLLSNAVKFTNEGGSVTLRVERSDPGIHVSVADTGIGIAPEEQAIVFEEFRQASGERAREEGTGLGLALARRLVELHGGRIWLESVVGTGSTFHFTLPQALRTAGDDGGAPS